MNVCFAWVVRSILLALYIPLRVLSILVESAHRLDLWASSVVLQSRVPANSRILSKVAPQRSSAAEDQAAYSTVDPALAFEMMAPKDQPVHRV